MSEKRESNKTTRMPLLIGGVLSVPLVILPGVVRCLYKQFFGKRYETPTWLSYKVEEFDGLTVERSDFFSEGTRLAGFKYSKGTGKKKGVVVIAHGIGGGHNAYMPFADFFASHGYFVFAYDAKGTDNSTGATIDGLPRGIVNLSDAIRHLAAVEEYQGLPVALIGHSWGGYSVANVLNLHPEVNAAAILSGFNESADLLKYQGRRLLGKCADAIVPYFRLYEKLMFKPCYLKNNGIDGMRKTDAGIMILHSKDDSVVPTQYGYDLFFEEFKKEERFRFVLLEDREHKLFCTKAAVEKADRTFAECKKYLKRKRLKYNAENEARYMAAHMDKAACFALDPELMQQILSFYDEFCEKSPLQESL